MCIKVSVFIITIAMSKLRKPICVVSCCSKVGYISVFLRERAGWGLREREGWHGHGRLLADAAIVPGARCAQCSPRTAGSFPARPQVPNPGILAPSPVLVLSQHLPAEVSGSGRIHTAALHQHLTIIPPCDDDPAPDAL